MIAKVLYNTLCYGLEKNFYQGTQIWERFVLITAGTSQEGVKEVELWSKHFSIGFPITDMRAFFSC